MNDIRPLRCVVRAEELGLYTDASGALAAARVAADRCIAEAQAEADALRSQAYDQGLAAAQAEAARMIAGAAALVQRQVRDLRPAIAAAIADGVAAVIGGLERDERIGRAAAHAVATLQDRARVTVRVAPGHAHAVRQGLAADVTAVIEDATLEADNCVIETESGFVQAGIRVQLAILREALSAVA